MRLETLRTYLLKKKGATEECPFGPETLVFKVAGKMFALVAWEETPLRMTLKCDPDHALHLRANYKAVQPGYYMNREHWNTIALDGTIPTDGRARVDLRTSKPKPALQFYPDTLQS